MALSPGTRLGAYEILTLIGSGGMGEVYRARDRKLERDVAIKVLPDAVASDPDRIGRFEREARTLAALNHPGIALIHGLEESNGTRALVMELVDGPTLADRIAKGPIPLDEALQIAKQIAEALEAAHEQGIIHRDLKPGNIKVKEDGTVKVLDFGLAKAVENTSGASVDAMNSPTITTPAMMTGVGMILGTAAYMSPEQAKSRPADKRSDIWAFGCVLYEMLTGRRAFQGDHVSDTLAAVLRGEPDWTTLPSETPPGLRALIQRTLAKDRSRRFSDIALVQFLLDNLATLAPTTEPVPTRQPRWKSASAVAASILATAVVVATGTWTLQPHTAAPPVTRFSLVLPTQGRQFFAAIQRHFLTISPDGTQVVYASNTGLFLRSFTEFDAHAIPGTDASLTQPIDPTFSPDGRSIAFAADNAIKRVPVSGGTVVTVCNPGRSPDGMTWDSTGIVFAEPARGIFRCPVNGGAPEQLAAVNTGEEAAQSPQMLPDGSAFLFGIAKISDGPARWDKAQIVVQTLKSGRRKVLVNGGSDARYLPTGHLLYAIGGIVFAVPFDPVRQEIAGTPVPVLEGVRRPNFGASGAAQFATSRTGTLMYVPGPVGTAATVLGLAVADRAGVMTRLAVAPGLYVQVRASRDGTRLAVGSDDGKEAIVWIYELAGTSAMRRLTIAGHNRFPIWSADGQRIAYQSDRDGDAGIYWQRVDGTGPVERLTKPAQGETHVPESWSPDGNHLAFSITKGSSLSLWTLSVADRTIKAFGGVKSSEPIGATFSPDGRWIAYASSPAVGEFVSPDRGVFIQPFPATGAVYQVPRRSLDFQPLWSPKGSELLFVPSAASGQFTSVRVTTQPIVTFGTPVNLPARVTANRLSPEPRAFDILPDGRFVGLAVPSEAESTESAAPQIRIVLNWFEELKARVPTK